MKAKSRSYFILLDILFKTKTKKRTEVYTTTQDNNEIKRNKIDVVNVAPDQEGISITDNRLFKMCTPPQWYIVGIITYDLTMNNALWECPPNIKNSGTLKRALKGLLDMNILFKTETTNIYLVNPFYIRRGNFYTVCMTTLSLLETTSKIQTKHIMNMKGVNSMPTPEEYKHTIPTVEIGYGYDIIDHTNTSN